MSSNWKTYTLDKLYDVSSGLSKKREEFGFGYPFLTFKEVFHNIFVPELLPELANTTEKERERCSIKKGDVFLTRTSEKLEELGLSCVALKDYENATFNGFTKRLRPNSLCNEILLPEYAAFYFSSNAFRNQVTSFASMTTRASLNNEMISKLKIDIPSLYVQEQIANLMQNLLKKELVNNQIIKSLESIACELFKRWFIDFEFPNEQGLPYRSSGGEMVESEFGSIPKGFEIIKAEELFDINIGKTPPRKETHHFSTSEGKKWVSISDMKSNEPYIINTKECLTLDAIDKFKVKVVPSDTVIVSFKLTVGRVCITIEEMLTNEAIAHFNIKDSDKMSTEYTYLYLKDFNYEQLGSTSSIATAINSKIVKTIPFLVPNKELLFNFSKIVTPLFKLIKSKQIENQKLIEIRESLLPRLLSGEIEISDESVVEPS